MKTAKTDLYQEIGHLSIQCRNVVPPTDIPLLEDGPSYCQHPLLRQYPYLLLPAAADARRRVEAFPYHSNAS